MRLYMVPAAPNPTKVMLYLAEKAAAGTQLPIEQTVVNTLQGRQRSPEHLARNPFGSLPVLDLGENDTIIESLAIIEYLEETYPQPSLWGSSPRERARSRELERIADVRVLSPMGRYIHATKSPLGRPKQPEVAGEAARNLPSALQYLDDLLSDDRELLMGDWVSVADCTLQAALQFMRFAKMNLISDYPHLMRWDAAYRQRPAARQVLKF